jgi:tetratricopeptide (TPR) repeat protein
VLSKLLNSTFQQYLHDGNHRDFDWAISFLTYLTDIDQDDASMHANLGWINLALNHWREGVIEYQTAMEMDPRNKKAVRLHQWYQQIRCHNPQCKTIGDVKGVFFFCKECRHFGVCSDCSTVYHHDNGNHRFIQIPSQEWIVAKGLVSPPLIYANLCNRILLAPDDGRLISNLKMQYDKNG